MNGPFKYELVQAVKGEHFRISDTYDSRIATCYLEQNARYIVEQLNRVDSLTADLKAAEAKAAELDSKLQGAMVALRDNDTELRRLEKLLSALDGRTA